MIGIVMLLISGLGTTDGIRDPFRDFISGRSHSSRAQSDQHNDTDHNTVRDDLQLNATIMVTSDMNEISIINH